jgi:hypothetical protein
MGEQLDKEVKEILVLIDAIHPLIDAYYKGELSEEEVEYLRAVTQSMWPVLQNVITGIWTELVPIMTRLGLWPPKEEEE